MATKEDVESDAQEGVRAPLMVNVAGSASGSGGGNLWMVYLSTFVAICGSYEFGCCVSDCCAFFLAFCWDFRETGQWFTEKLWCLDSLSNTLVLLSGRLFFAYSVRNPGRSQFNIIWGMEVIKTSITHPSCFVWMVKLRVKIHICSEIWRTWQTFLHLGHHGSGWISRASELPCASTFSCNSCVTALGYTTTMASQVRFALSAEPAIQAKKTYIACVNSFRFKKQSVKISIEYDLEIWQYSGRIFSKQFDYTFSTMVLQIFFQLTCWFFLCMQYSVFGSILTFGAMVGAITIGPIADFLGRKGVWIQNSCSELLVLNWCCFNWCSIRYLTICSL